MRVGVVAPRTGTAVLLAAGDEGLKNCVVLHISVAIQSVRVKEFSWRFSVCLTWSE